MSRSSFFSYQIRRRLFRRRELTSIRFPPSTSPSPSCRKAVANAMKSKGLGRLRWFCQVCEKQCRDDNGFKCHVATEAVSSPSPSLPCLPIAFSSSSDFKLTLLSTRHPFSIFDRCSSSESLLGSTSTTSPRASWTSSFSFSRDGSFPPPLSSFLLFVRPPHLELISSLLLALTDITPSESEPIKSTRSTFRTRSIST